MRVGLFGGSFNPIHFGHLRSAEEDREALNLDLVYFIPAASPPHKTEGDLAPAEHRLAMVRLATKGNRHFMASDVEIRRTGRSYTIETVKYFLATLRPPAVLYLLMGADQFAELETWKSCDELVSLCNLAVHSRLPEGEGGPPKKIITCTRVVTRFRSYRQPSFQFRRPPSAAKFSARNRSTISSPATSLITSSVTPSIE